mgnify:CR=1 FL=1
MPQDLRPYLMSATYEFIVDRGETPYITVWADERCVVPREFVKEQIINRDGDVAPIITLNISMAATPNLEIPKEGSAVVFNGSFGGRKMEVFVPFDCVLAMYSHETPNHAMAFEYITPAERQNTEAPEPPKGKPSLKVIK